jgi:release factor glutamine methyltransferase
MLALDGGDDGLNPYRYIAKNIKKNMKNNTMIFLEIGQGQDDDIKGIFGQCGFVLKKIYKDFGGINRAMVFCL